MIFLHYHIHKKGRILSYAQFVQLLRASNCGLYPQIVTVVGCTYFFIIKLKMCNCCGVAHFLFFMGFVRGATPVTLNVVKGPTAKAATQKEMFRRGST